MTSFIQRARRWRAVARIEILQLVQDRPTLSIILVGRPVNVASRGEGYRPSERVSQFLDQSRANGFRNHLIHMALLLLSGGRIRIKFLLPGRRIEEIRVHR